MMRARALWMAGVFGATVLGCSHLDGLDNPPEEDRTSDRDPTGLIDAGDDDAKAERDAGRIPADAAASRDAASAGGAAADASVPPPPLPADAGPPAVLDAGRPDAGVADAGPRFEDRGAVVYDSVAKKYWQQNLPNNYMGCTGRIARENACSFAQATRYCANLVLGGYSDWALPTMNELLTLVDTSFDDSTIDEDLFPDTPPLNFWTQSSSPSAPSQRFSVDFELGQAASWDEDYYLLVRCVR